MRIISGTLKGRLINSPHGHVTHPMSEKMRGSIFNVLGDIAGLKVLDAFSGSGAVAIEAVSRGAGEVVAIDNSKKAFQTITQNVKDLDIKNIKVTMANITAWLDNNPEMKFDIIICDPPYDLFKQNQIKPLEKHLAENGLLILSLPDNADYSTKLQKLVEKNYGDAKLLFYR